MDRYRRLHLPLCSTSICGNVLRVPTTVYHRYVEETQLLGGLYAKISTDDRGIYFFTESCRPEVKKYIQRSEVYHLSIYTDEEVVARGKNIYTEVRSG